MQHIRLSFGEIIILKNNLVEIIVDDGVEVNEVMVDELHDFLLTNLEAPFRLLINSKNSYSYTFRAQILIANLKEIEAIGVTVGSNCTLMSIETIIFLNKNKNWNIELFMTRVEALAWLQCLKNEYVLS